MAPREEHGERAAAYRFGPRDQRGLVAGIRAPQGAILAIALASAVGVARGVGANGGVPLAMLVVLLGAAAAFVPFAGRTVDRWVPVFVAHGATLLHELARGQRAARVPRAAALAPQERRTPGALSTLSVVELELGERERIGAIADRREATLTGVLSLGAGPFGLLDEDDRHQCVAAWSGVLAALASETSDLVRVQWIERTVPGAELGTPALPVSPRPDHPAGVAAARAGYRRLVRTEHGRLCHELLVALSVRAPRARAGTPSSSAAVLSRELAGLERRLRASGIAVDGALSADGLRACLRRSFALGVHQGPAVASAWPAGVCARWGHVATDETLHAIYWIAEWPRHEVRSDFLLPLLLDGQDRRSLSLVMAPVAVRRAVRAAEHARTSTTADAQLRARHGFALSARTRREHEAVAQREVELSEGHAGYRFSGYLGVTAADVTELAAACRRVEQLAALCRLELLRLVGTQAEALTRLLPCGRGCA